MTLSTLTTSQLSQVRLELVDVEAMVSQVRDQQRQLTAVNINIIRDIQQAVAQRGVCLEWLEQTLPHNPAQIQETSPQEIMGSDTPQGPQPEVLHQERSEITIPSNYTRLDVL